MLVKCECGWTGDPWKDSSQIYKTGCSCPECGSYYIYVCPDCGAHNEEDCWEYIEEKENTLDI